MTIPTKQQLCYGNWKVHAPTGELMFRCDDKRANWYLRRSLAEVIDDNTIKLKFTPAGLGHQGDEYYLSSRNNACVVCGTTEGLTKHHVIPHMYRKHLPLEVKSRASHDLLVICDDHHMAYEAVATQLKAEIAREAGAPQTTVTDKSLRRVRAAARALYGPHLAKIPADRQRVLEGTLVAHFGQLPSKDQVNELLTESDVVTTRDDGAHVVKLLIERDEVFSFVVMWRQHFIDVMSPKHMPTGWDVHKPLQKP